MVFHSISGMMKWAFETHATPAGATSCLRGEGGGGRGSDLAPHEQRAQAAQVVSWVSTLPLAEKLIILGLCDSAMSAHTVAFGLVGGIPAEYGIAAAQCAVLRWLDPEGAVTIRTLADKMQRSPEPAYRYFNKVARCLDALRQSAFERAAHRFAALLSERAAPVPKTQNCSPPVDAKPKQKQNAPAVLEWCA